MNRAALEVQLWDDGNCDPGALGRVKAQQELIDDLKEGKADEWNDWAEHFERQRIATR